MGISVPIPNIVIPGPHEDERIRAARHEKYDERICENLGYPPELPTNVRLEHNPNWRNEVPLGFVSIQCAHDCSHWVWQFVRVIWIVGQFAGPAFGLGYIVSYR